MNTCILDIETTSLDGVGAGFLLCAVMQDFTTGKQTVYRIDEYGCPAAGEAPLLKDILTHLRNYHLVVGHNLINFDMKFLKTRAMRLGVKYGYKPYVYDTMKAFRNAGILTVQNKFGKPSAALDMVIDAFGYDQRKSKIYPADWWSAVWGMQRKHLVWYNNLGRKVDKSPAEVRKMAMNHIVDHCKADVAMTGNVYCELLDEDEKTVIRRIL